MGAGSAVISLRARIQQLNCDLAFVIAERDGYEHQLLRLKQGIEQLPTDARFQAAVAAMQGMVGCQDFMNEVISKVATSKDEAREMVAVWAVKQADALLAELNKPTDATNG